MKIYRRRLPHWHKIDRSTFITWRLHGSLPAGWQPKRDELTPGQAFVAMDRLLDACSSGPQHLKIPHIAELVVEAMLHLGNEMRRYDLHGFVVMSNHVHMLITPNIDVVAIMKSLKGFTARQANDVLRLSGPFWQRESYDHLVRSATEFCRIRAYIENNPVRVGLVETPAQYRWSSAWSGWA